MIKYIGLLACLTSVLWNVGCASLGCSSGETEVPLVRVAHLSGGVGPVVYLLEVSEGGQARLEKVGFRTYCRSVSNEEIEAIRRLIEDTKFGEIPWSSNTGLGHEEAHVFTDGVETRVVLPDPPRELVPLFETLDTLYREHFGWRYDMPLL